MPGIDRPMGTNTISNRGDNLRRALDDWHNASRAWVEATMEVAFQLCSARKAYGRDDRAFGRWLTENGCDISPDDRSALISMAEHAGISRVVLATTARRSVQHIWRNEIRPKVHPPEPDGDDDDLSSDDERCGDLADRPKPPTPPPEFLAISEEECAQARADAQRRQRAMADAFTAQQAASEARRLKIQEETAVARATMLAERDQEDEAEEALPGEEPEETVSESLEALIAAWNFCSAEEQWFFLDHAVRGQRFSLWDIEQERAKAAEADQTEEAINARNAARLTEH
jgi:hypothetical protein